MAGKHFIPNEDMEKYNKLNQGKIDASNAWKNAATQEERDSAHRNAEYLYAQTDAMDGGKSTFDPNTGTWSTSYSDDKGNWVNSGVPSAVGYVSQYDNKINNLMGDIENSKFSYNPYNDPSYKAYENMYRREGDRASKSTLADISTAQGGVSSYAAQAAQQASNLYAQQLTDKIPELEALAYQKYGADMNSKYNLLNAYMGRDESERNQFNLNRNYNQTEKWNQIYLDTDNYWKGQDLELNKENLGINKEYLGLEKDKFGEEQKMNNFDIETTNRQLAMQEQQIKDGKEINMMELTMSIATAVAQGITPPKTVLDYIGMSESDVKNILKGFNNNSNEVLTNQYKIQSSFR